MSERTSTPYRHVGTEGSPATMEVCQHMGKSGNDHPDQQGQIFVAPYSASDLVGMTNPLPARIMTKRPQGPTGETVHDRILDGMQLSCRSMPDGTILVDTVWPAWDGPQTMGTGGASGNPTYTGRSPKGK